MRRSGFFFLLVFLNSSCHLSLAQDSDSTLLSQVETELSFADSLSIFNLIDSLLQHARQEAHKLVCASHTTVT